LGARGARGLRGLPSVTNRRGSLNTPLRKCSPSSTHAACTRFS
jgi:hypothetical protein